MKTRRDFNAKDFSATRQEIGRLLDQALAIAQAETEYQGKAAQSTSVIPLLMAARKKWERQSFQIAALALAKSGKSTLLNAWLGDEYLPSASTPETARIVRIRHDPKATAGSLKDRDEVKASGAQEVRAFLRDLNDQTRQNQTMPPEDELLLSAPLIALADSEFGDQRFELLDTPGPNEAGTEVLKAKVERLLDEVDVIVYLLDYTKLKTEEERLLFEKLVSLRPELLKTYEKRLFFVVNKVDEQNRNGLTRDQTADYVVGVLRKQLGLQVPPSRILPVSAEYALLARLVASGRATPEVIVDFAKEALGIRAARNATREMCLPHADGLLADSNIKAVEEAVLNYVFRDRGRLLVDTLLSDHLKRALDRLENQLKTAQGTLRVDQEELTRRVKKLETDLRSTERQVDVVGQKTERFKRDTEEWIRRQFDTFKARTADEIDRAFEEGETRQRGGLASRLYKRVKDLVGVESQDKREMGKQVIDLNRAISQQLQNEFEVFRLDLEREAQVHQRRLFSELEGILEPLARQIEEKVSQTLDITLNPVSMSFATPSLDELHGDIEDKIGSFIATKRKTETTYSRKRVVTKKGSWCSKDEYGYQNIPHEHVVTNHGIKVDKIREFWTTKIAEMTEVSVSTSRKVIAASLEQALDRARQELSRQCESYMATIRREIEEKKRGEAQWRQRLKDVDARLGECRKLREDAKRCEEIVR